jgi:DNA-directed RNA polymerase subunit M/transcription elongation factor TFIIS
MNYKGIKDEKHFCLNCGKLLQFKRYGHKYTFCNNKCRGEYQTKQSIELLKEGKLQDFNRKRIKFAMLAIGIENKCAICGITEWRGKPLPMTLDHIDGDASNNKLENLRFICNNCDAQTEYYRARNKGNGRKARKMI